MCDTCNKTFNTITNLKQHEKGKHGEGYIALCGTVYDWGDGRNDRQTDCLECKAIRDKKESLPEKPVKKRQWKSSVAKDNATKYFWKEKKTQDGGSEDNNSQLSMLSSDLSSDLSIVLDDFQHIPHCVFPFV